ncbi:hypothetical protein MHLP_02055 [Candidatus Mycoplasma haematolamae str. Purdue]|uniref:Uncharacterized protein n=1 Tax=Mycoplasma haematolamae (strain Purdue) TaxID=1212765 RepID=I7CFK7_MYCHA|nr:hypothetical protein [Candidatus Mycoplasma haematolamae]AFO51991.1 hypothetical protein MHLP_02055 [Candidatus Mycoplasma haematolamae str. Purdue]
MTTAAKAIIASLLGAVSLTGGGAVYFTQGSSWAKEPEQSTTLLKKEESEQRGAEKLIDVRAETVQTSNDGLAPVSQPESEEKSIKTPVSIEDQGTEYEEDDNDEMDNLPSSEELKGRLILVKKDSYFGSDGYQYELTVKYSEEPSVLDGVEQASVEFAIENKRTTVKKFLDDVNAMLGTGFDPLQDVLDELSRKRTSFEEVFEGKLYDSFVAEINKAGK